MTARVEGSVRPHEVEWTEPKIRRFWGWWGEHLGDEAFFSRDYGWAILDILERRVPLAGKRAVDIGTGPGYLLDELLARGARCSGVEPSAELADRANERLRNQSGFGGVAEASAGRLPLPDDEVDIACSLEVVEHLLDDQLHGHMREMARVVREGGFVLVSTPNEENFDTYRTVCPDCGALFHRIQHVRRWTGDQLVAYMREVGFEPELVVRTVLGRNRAHALLARLRHVARRTWRTDVAALPQLVYVGRRV